MPNSNAKRLYVCTCVFSLLHSQFATADRQTNEKDMLFKSFELSQSTRSQLSY